MPRILPRLLQKIASSSRFTEKQEPVRRPRRKSVQRKCLPAPSFVPYGRSHSILLDPQNPITNASDYVQHKSRPPQISVPNSNVGTDGPRPMTEEERSWWSSPYLRMLSSPVRMCFVTSRYLPNDFLIRLAPKRVQSPLLARPTQYLLPDGLEHPKYKGRKCGRALYIICWKRALQQLTEQGSYKRLSLNTVMHSLLEQHVAHLLRSRVLQELQILADRLQARPQKSHGHPILRRLTRAEFKAIRTTGIIPYESAVAVLVVPPLNRDPVTKAKPEPSFSASPPEQHADKPPRQALPLSILHPTNSTTQDHSGEPVHPQVPLYNGVTLFPSRPQRAALHARLSRLLSIERRGRFREQGKGHGPSPPAEDSTTKLPPGDQKASHAFLLCSDASTSERADAAAAAIALWRLRMWDGGGWEDSPMGGGWLQI